jgi:hydrogenase expression/formation protein HypC
MCLAVPGKILALEGGIARVDFGGVERDLCMDLLPEVGCGAWVLAHAGFAIQVLDEEEAQATLALFQEWADFEAQSALGPTERSAPGGGHDA